MNPSPFLRCLLVSVPLLLSAFGLRRRHVYHVRQFFDVHLY